ncbi:hypothetical protein PFDG_03449 [Plasmodium falciparum Dd2]|uniref:Stevor n=1 Tax=Plasmodium falciparum (isolate Dd2) TaxID=57267 RepID=A0A0L7M4L5_PLAF4|nr:hypothetical protein PFDG_03449 [Plasmodium falciparum Dd2]
MLLFSLLFNTFLLSQNVNCRNNFLNIKLIHNDTQRTTIKSRLLAQTKNHNPHYNNDPELKKIIDKLNAEAIKKYQHTHEPYEQLQEVVEKKGKKTVGTHGAEPMSTIEKELLEIYEEIFGNENHNIVKSDIYTNKYNKSNDKNDKSCECANNKKSSNKLSLSNKVHDNYLDNLKAGCVGSAAACAVSSVFVGKCGIVAGSAAAAKAAAATFPLFNVKITSALSGVNFFYLSSLETAIKTVVPAQFSNLLEASSTVASASSAGTATFFTYGMAIVALIAVTIIVILLYIWLSKRRKNSWKHECKKHLCT